VCRHHGVLRRRGRGTRGRDSARPPRRSRFPVGAVNQTLGRESRRGASRPAARRSGGFRRICPEGPRSGRAGAVRPRRGGDDFPQRGGLRRGTRARGNRAFFEFFVGGTNFCIRSRRLSIRFPSPKPWSEPQQAPAAATETAGGNRNRQRPRVGALPDGPFRLWVCRTTEERRNQRAKHSALGTLPAPWKTRRQTQRRKEPSR
jgi:hypothetical protein